MNKYLTNYIINIRYLSSPAVSQICKDKTELSCNVIFFSMYAAPKVA